MTADIDPVLSARPDDQPPPPRREAYTTARLNAALDTAAGIFLAAQHGGRAQAAAAIEDGARQNLAWRQAQAETLFERYPGRYASVADARAAVPDPVGGQGAWLSGEVDEIVRAVRRVAPFARIRNLGEPDVAPGQAYSGGPDGRVHVADVRPPWQRGD